jgi:hypothetical protein
MQRSMSPKRSRRDLCTSILPNVSQHPAICTVPRLSRFCIVYGNEESVGEAIRESGLGRSELFVTTKYISGPILQTAGASLAKVCFCHLHDSVDPSSLVTYGGNSSGWNKSTYISYIALQQSGIISKQLGRSLRRSRTSVWRSRSSVALSVSVFFTFAG